MKIIIPDWLREVMEDASRRVADTPEYLLAPELQRYRAAKRRQTEGTTDTLKEGEAIESSKCS